MKFVITQLSGTHEGPLQYLQEFPTWIFSEALNPRVRNEEYNLRRNAGTTSPNDEAKTKGEVPL
jgi:hypothetical protein